MEKDELMRRAQHDHRKGDERERWLQQKVLHDVSGVTALAVLAIGRLSWFGAIGGQITVFGAPLPADLLFIMLAGISAIIYDVLMFRQHRTKRHLLYAFCLLSILLIELLEKR